MLTTSTDDLNEKIVKYGKYAALFRLADHPRNQQIFMREDGVSLLYRLSECPKSYTIGYLTPKSSIFRETISMYVNRFLENGLFAKSERDTMYIFALEGGIQNRRFHRSNQIQLTTSHLQLAFFILGIGMVISSMVWAFEVWVSRH